MIRLSVGGHVLPYQGRESAIQGHQMALIGGRAYCDGCNSVGIIAKAGGPSRINFISEVAMEGDVVICHCPAPPHLSATLQNVFRHEDMAGGHHEFDLSMIGPGWFSNDAVNVAASKKSVDSAVRHPPEAEQTENICPNMTNREFCMTALKLRDDAVALISRKRLPELERWDKDAQARVKEWFGVAEQQMREHLQKGLAACESDLRGLKSAKLCALLGGGAKECRMRLAWQPHGGFRWGMQAGYGDSHYCHQPRFLLVPQEQNRVRHRHNR